MGIHRGACLEVALSGELVQAVRRGNIDRRGDVHQLQESKPRAEAGRYRQRRYVFAGCSLQELVEAAQEGDVICGVTSIDGNTPNFGVSAGVLALSRSPDCRVATVVGVMSNAE